MNYKSCRLRTLKFLLLPLLLSGCAMIGGAKDEGLDVFEDVIKADSKLKGKKNIFVFLDGTKNGPDSNTNVWRLHSLVKSQNDPSVSSLYVEGVGGVNDMPITGALLGKGMQKRITRGYEFISAEYLPGANVFIFGFSRGAHQARALAGMISYAGLPTSGTSDGVATANSILDILKKKIDEDYREAWQAWRPKANPLLKAELEDQLEISVQPAEVSFLGLWDTVPGSSLKDYGTCKEKRGWIKRNLSWLIPGIDPGERYKSHSYPPIKRIAQAVALDEKRSKFAPLLLCDPINPGLTETHEVWFPGAHADIGGGYDDSSDLPSISLGWMIERLHSDYSIKLDSPIVGDPLGLAHWSIGYSPANKFSECVDRKPQSDAIIHPSVEKRSVAPLVPIKLDEDSPAVSKAYPLNC